MDFVQHDRNRLPLKYAVYRGQLHSFLVIRFHLVQNLLRCQLLKLAISLFTCSTWILHLTKGERRDACYWVVQFWAAKSWNQALSGNLGGLQKHLSQGQDSSNKLASLREAKQYAENYYALFTAVWNSAWRAWPNFLWLHSLPTLVLTATVKIDQ